MRNLYVGRVVFDEQDGVRGRHHSIVRVREASRHSPPASFPVLLAPCTQGVSFEERMQELTMTLGEQMRQGQRLDAEIKTQLLKVGFKIGDI